MRAPWAIVCDFDGTALTEDLGDLVAYRFAGDGELPRRGGRVPRRRVPVQRAARAGCSRRSPRRARRSRRSRARRAVLRPGFEALRRGVPRGRAARSSSSPPGSTRTSSRSSSGSRPRCARHVEVRANRAELSAGGARGPRSTARDCGFCGFCKGDVVRELQAAGNKVVLCGDGTGDRHAADAADSVFARTGSSPRALLRRARHPARRVRDVRRGDGAVSGVRAAAPFAHLDGAEITSRFLTRSSRSVPSGKCPRLPRKTRSPRRRALSSNSRARRSGTHSRRSSSPGSPRSSSMLVRCSCPRVTSDRGCTSPLQGERSSWSPPRCGGVAGRSSPRSAPSTPR